MRLITHPAHICTRTIKVQAKRVSDVVSDLGVLTITCETGRVVSVRVQVDINTRVTCGGPADLRSPTDLESLEQSEESVRHSGHIESTDARRPHSIS